MLMFGVKMRTIFFSCFAEDVDVGETRRKHPLSKDGNILDSVEKEREILESVDPISS